MRRSVLAGVALAMAVGGWSAAELMAQETREAVAARRRIELTGPGEYGESNCLYVMTKDVTAKGNGFTFDGKNVVIDLGGHTLTFNTEPYKTDAGTKYMFRSPFGILLKGENVELKNGSILQGTGHNSQAKCVFVRGKKCNIHHTTTVISGGDQGRNFYSVWGTDGIRLHHNYIVNHGVAESNWYGAVSFTETGVNHDIHHNTIVGGHQGILISGQRERQNAHVHHNYIQHKRTRGAKAPQGIYIRASGCEIDHNEIVSIDGRGIMPVGRNNHWHDNIVDVRYTSKAEGGFYPENRCYGYWSRGDSSGSRIINNLFVVNNEVVGDRTSNTIGILLFREGALLRNCTITGNRLLIRHNDKSRPSRGLWVGNVEDSVLIKDNYIWADTAGLLIDSRARGARIEGNTFVRANNKWEMKTGAGAANCVFKGNKIIPPPDDKEPPAAPTGLRIIRRFNGYELHWKPNAEDDVLGYYVHRDGKRVEDRMKCGRFYVDLSADPKGKFEYAVSAVDLAGNEGPKCPPVSTAPAK